jgi:hypothetical protein
MDVCVGQRAAFTTKYYCVHHGEIPELHFSLGHQSAISTRKAAKIGGGLLLVFVVLVLMVRSSFLRSIR